MRLLFRILPIGLLLLIALGVLTGRQLPAEHEVARSLFIEAPPPAVFDRVGRIRGWEGWYVPPGEGRFEGPEGEGGVLVVEDEETGETLRLELTETSSPTRVRYRFPHGPEDPFRIDGRFELEAVEGGTRVTSVQHLRAQSDGWLRAAGERWFLRMLANNLIGSVLSRELDNLRREVLGLPPPGAERDQASDAEAAQ